MDLIKIAVARRAGLERGKIGAGVRLGEHRRRQHFAGRDLRQPFAFLLLGAAAQNKLGRDLGAGAEAADADIAARQLLGDDTHRFFAKPHAAVILGDGQTEHAELGHLGDDIERNVLVAQMPLLRMRHHLAFGELAHLLADGFERIIEAAGTDGRVVSELHQLDQPGAVRRGVALRNQLLDRGSDARGDRRGMKSEISKADDLALAHRNPAQDLRQIFAGADPHDEVFDLTETVSFHQALGISAKLADGIDIGREPSKAMGGALFAVEELPGDTAVPCHPLGDRPARIGEYGFNRLYRLRQGGDQVFAGSRAVGLSKRHQWLRSLVSGRSPDSVFKLTRAVHKSQFRTAISGQPVARHCGCQRSCTA